MSRAASLLIVLLVATSVEAQTSSQPARPYRGLFATKRPNPNSRQSLDLILSLNQAYDDNETDRSDGDVSGLAVNRSGLYSNANGALRYLRGGSTPWLSLTVGSVGRYYSDLHQFMPAHHRLDASLRVPIWHGATATLNPSTEYTPYYAFMPIPAAPAAESSEPPAPVAPSADFIVKKQAAHAIAGTIDLTQKVSERLALIAAYERRDVLSRDHLRDLRTEGASIKLTYRLSQYVGFHARVASRSARYNAPMGPTPTAVASDVVPSDAVPSGAAVPSDAVASDAVPSDAAPSGVAPQGASPWGTTRLRADDIDIGLDFARPLSVSRRAVLRFTSGSSLIPQDGKRYYRVAGDASLTYQLGRTWNAGVQYHRALQFLEMFPQPFFADSVSTSVRGYVTRRIDVGVTGSYSKGEVGVADDGGPSQMYTGSAQFGVALTRHMAFSGEYVYYRYGLGQPPLGDLPQRLERQTARVGLKLWFPIFD